MTQVLITEPLFSFVPFIETRSDALRAIGEFCAQTPYRSAILEEFDLDGDFYRRPLRPEDLSFLRFEQPVVADSVCLLPSLHAQRMLLSIQELDTAVILTGELVHDLGRQQRCAEFYADSARILGARIRPFLENFVFEYLCDPTQSASPRELCDMFETLLYDETRSWSAMFGHVIARGYAREGLRFALIQEGCLWHAKYVAFERARALGYFATIDELQQPSLRGCLIEEGTLDALFRELGIKASPHSHWQLYLSTSLAKCNLLHALGRRPDRALAFCGAAFAAEAQWLAFGAAAVRLAREALKFNGSPVADARLRAELLSRFEVAVNDVLRRCGSAGLLQMQQGLQAAVRLAASARRNLSEQLRWLSTVDVYMRLARQVSERIERECPDIDRDTFVEPRDMCSTMHVHDDHRLVVIESGDMVFWGNLGMELALTTGDMVLIPAGRLHGSTVTSIECTYHQPIIPDAWVTPLVQAAGV